VHPRALCCRGAASKDRFRPVMNYSEGAHSGTHAPDCAGATPARLISRQPSHRSLHFFGETLDPQLCAPAFRPVCLCQETNVIHITGRTISRAGGRISGLWGGRDPPGDGRDGRRPSHDRRRPRITRKSLNRRTREEVSPRALNHGSSQAVHNEGNAPFRI
jgi:hypothetical protein